MKPACPLVALLLLLAVSPVVFPAGEEDFDALVDFSVTIKTLNRLDEAGARAYGLLGRYLLLDATVTNIIILDANEASFLVQVELVSGEWIGLEEVRSYSCWVVFAGPRFFPLFPRRVPREAPPGIVKLNDQILVVARLLQQVEDGNGEAVWVLEGIHARVLR